MLKVRFAVIALLMLTPFGYGFDPDLNWKTLTTKHFDIHFSESNQALASEVSLLAESIHNELTVTLNWKPKSKTQLVITDHTDIANGYASPLPFNRSVLFVHPPKAGNLDFRSWLRSLIVHEYTHVLHLDKAEGIPDNVRSILGRFWLLFPNTFQPSWMIEGYATYLETDFSRAEGRGQSSMFAIMMREELRSGFKSISEVNISSASWPLNARYLYGYYFYHFIEQKFGSEAINQLIENYSDNWFPYLLNSNSEFVLGQQLDSLWLEFEVFLRRELKISSDNSVAIDRKLSTSSGFFKSSLTSGENGEIWFLGNDGYTQSGLYQLKNDELIKLTDINSLGSLDFHSERGLIYAQPEICDEYNIYYDLYRYDLISNTVVRLTECSRYSEARWLADGTGVIALRYSSGKPILDLLTVNGSFIRELHRGDDEVISYIDVSPNGKTVVASVQRPSSSRARLEIFDIEQKSWRALTNENNHAWQAEFVDNSNIIFSAETDAKQFSLNQINIDNNNISRITNSLYSFFEPIYIENSNSVAALSYTANGYDLVTLNTESFNTVSHLYIGIEGVKPDQKEYSSPSIKQSEHNREVNDYSAWDTLSPKYWFPFAVGNENSQEVGIQTSGMDALENHIYSLAFSLEIEKQKPNLFLNYLYDKSVDVLLQNYHDIIDDDDDSTFDLIEQNSEFEFAYHFPISTVLSQWDFEVALSIDSTREYLWFDDDEHLIREFNEVLAGVAINFNSAKNFLRSISINDGRSVRFAFAETGIWDSDFDGKRMLLDWREYFQLHQEHVLALRLFVGSSEQGAKPFQVGGDFSAPFQIRQRTLIDDRIAFRGYPGFSRLLYGRHVRFASVEWRFPIAHVERTWMSPPIGLDEISGRLFYEGARVYGHSQNTLQIYPGENIADKTYYSSGVEILAKFKLFYSLPLDVRFGYAEGLDERIGEKSSYVSFGTSF
ncbi:MAG: hypothetical protein HWE27_04715 [Gammaproteobacteria bacterium]|nr:hypothetical protein [Gammaproteobacteria bacterium]